MIGGLRDIRTQLLIVLGVLILADVAAIALLISPAGRSRGAREEEYERLRVQKIEKSQAVAPAQGMDQKIKAAREEQEQFNSERLVQRYSSLSEQLSRIAAESGVRVSAVKYTEGGGDATTGHDKTDKAGVPPGYSEVSITVDVHGTYDQDIRFINNVERQKMFLLIDAVSFSGMQGDTLTVSVHLSTFLRSAA